MTVGQRRAKLNAVPLVMGRGEYTVDLAERGMLHAAVLRSPVPHARIVRLDVARAARVPGVAAVVTAKDVAANTLGASVRHRPLLAIDVVRCVGEPVVALAASDEATAAAALALVEIEYAPLPGVFDVDAAVAPDAPLVQPDKLKYGRLPVLEQWVAREPGNVSHRIAIARGDADAALGRAAQVYKSRFTTQAVSQVSLEPHCAVAKIERSGRLAVWCSTGKPFRIHLQICGALGLDATKLRVEAPDVGGDFGTKGEISIEAIVALLALKTGRPVKGVCSREEEFTGTGLCVATSIEAAIGVAPDGRVEALDMTFRKDIGPYDGYGSMVTLWAAVCAGGPYDIANVRIVGESVFTNNLRGGAYRGFGNPQVSFARESLFDMAAKDLGIDPLELRRRNGWRHGSLSATSQTLSRELHGLGFIDTLDRLEERFATRDRAAASPTTGALRRGVGYASGMHGSGYGCLVDADTSGAIVKLNADGTFILHTGGYDVGQGVTTSIVQMVAATLGVEPERVALSDQNTDAVPFDNGASASRQLYISGKAALKAAEALRAQLLALAAKRLEIDVEKLELRDGAVQSPSSNRSMKLAEIAYYAIHVCGEQPVAFGTFALQGALLDREGKGDPISAFLFASQRAEVEVDIETGTVRVLSLAGAHDVGRAINPLLVEGQIEGGLMQGMGYALLEEVRQENGRPVKPDLEHYLVPTSADMPELVTIIVETDEPTGPMGAKGVGEAGLVPTAAAIANAVASATGVRVRDLPITPERLLKALKTKVGT
jgi:CO/xanthine dehydrogenase Mo-binding subunit